MAHKQITNVDNIEQIPEHINLQVVSYTRCEHKDPRDEHVVGIYTGFFFYEPLNQFLSKRDSLVNYQSLGPLIYTGDFYHYVTGSNDRQMDLPFLHSFTALPEARSHWNELEWFQNLFYQYTMDLYRAIARCPLQKRSSLVYRGVKQHYLKEDPTKAYPITTFLSTSAAKEIALGFSRGHLYHFYVMPDVPCVYYDSREQELIINPYVNYVFVKKDTVTLGGLFGDYTYTRYHYILFSSLIVPPNTFQEFMEFRDTIVGHSVSFGGSVETEMEPVRNVNNYRRNSKNNLSMSLRTRNRNRKYNNMTKRNKNHVNTMNTMSPMPSISPEIPSPHDRFRLSGPIGTGSKGVPLTKKMKETVQRIRTQIDSSSTHQ